MKNWKMRKVVLAREEMREEHRLRQSLGWPHLVALGVGAIVGTGILTLIGVGAGKAGPAVILSFAIAGAICACAALAYAEVATMIPASGSACRARWCRGPSSAACSTCRRSSSSGWWPGC
jgi:APA family basic amino acid/polyamine antiporter